MPPRGAKSEMLKQSQNAPYQNWQAKERGNFCKRKNIPSEHTAFNYFWTHSNAEGGSRRNSECVSSVGSRKLRAAEHAVFQPSPCGACKPRRNCARLGQGCAPTRTGHGSCWEPQGTERAPEDRESPGCCNCATGHAQHEGNAQLFLQPELLPPSEALSVFVHSGSIPVAVEATDLSAKKEKNPPDVAAQGRKN